MANYKRFESGNERERGGRKRCERLKVSEVRRHWKNLSIRLCLSRKDARSAGNSGPDGSREAGGPAGPGSHSEAGPPGSDTAAEVIKPGAAQTGDVRQRHGGHVSRQSKENGSVKHHDLVQDSFAKTSRRPLVSK